MPRAGSHEHTEGIFRNALMAGLIAGREAQNLDPSQRAYLESRADQIAVEIKPVSDAIAKKAMLDVLDVVIDHRISIGELMEWRRDIKKYETET